MFQKSLSPISLETPLGPHLDHQEWNAGGLRLLAEFNAVLAGREWSKDLECGLRTATIGERAAVARAAIAWEKSHPNVRPSEIVLNSYITLAEQLGADVHYSTRKKLLDFVVERAEKSGLRHMEFYARLGLTRAYEESGSYFLASLACKESLVIFKEIFPESVVSLCHLQVRCVKLLEKSGRSSEANALRSAVLGELDKVQDDKEKLRLRVELNDVDFCENSSDDPKLNLRIPEGALTVSRSSPNLATKYECTGLRVQDLVEKRSYLMAALLALDGETLYPRGYPQLVAILVSLGKTCYALQDYISAEAHLNYAIFSVFQWGEPNPIKHKELWTFKDALETYVRVSEHIAVDSKALVAINQELAVVRKLLK